MSEILALDWSDDRIRAVVVRTERGGIRVTAGFDALWPETTKPADDVAAAGAWLAERVKQYGYEGRDVRITLPRSAAAVRRLDLPAVPPEELPPMVEMQAAMRSSSGLDGLALDFVPVVDAGAAREDGEAEGWAVLAATTSRATMDRMIAVCDAAGLRVTSVGLGSLATADLVVRATDGDPNESALVVRVEDEVLETTLIRGSRVLFTQSSEIHAADDDQLGRAVAADIRRSLVAHGDGHDPQSLDHVWWIGDEARTETQRTFVSGRLRVPVQPFDPLANPVVTSDAHELDGSSVAAAVAAARTASGTRVEQLDFLDPRKPPKQVDVRKQRLIVAGCVAAVLLLGFFVWRTWRLSSLSSRIADLESEQYDLEKYVEERGPIRDRAKHVRTWEALRRDWLADIALLESEFPERDRALMTELRFEANARSGKVKVVGKGRAMTREEVEEFTHRLGTRGFTVEPKTIPPAIGSDYGTRFDLDATYPDKAKATAKAEPESNDEGADS